jgi:hypothetical protein
MAKSQPVRRARRGATAGRRMMVVLAAGALSAAARAPAQTDALGIAPPRTVSVEAAQGALSDRAERLGGRYARWQRARDLADSADALPAFPPNPAAPSAPDAPDGEITRQLEEAGQ